MTEYNYFATCSKGVEDLLQHELVQQGITDSKLRTGGVAFSGELTAAYRACLWSRVAVCCCSSKASRLPRMMIYTGK